MRFRRATSSDSTEAWALLREAGLPATTKYAPGSMLAWSTLILERRVMLAETRRYNRDEWDLVAVIIQPRDWDAAEIAHRCRAGHGGKTYEPIQIRAIRKEVNRRAQNGTRRREAAPEITWFPPIGVER